MWLGLQNARRFKLRLPNLTLLKLAEVSPPNSVTGSFLETRMDVKWEISFRRRYSDLVHGDQLFGAEVVDVGVNDVVRRR